MRPIITALTWLDLLLSGVLTWSIGLFVPVAIRVMVVRTPIRRTSALVIVGLQWVANLLFFVAIGSLSTAHLALFLIALVSYQILTGGASHPRPPFSWSTAIIIVCCFVAVTAILAAAILYVIPPSVLNSRPFEISP